MTTNHSPDLNQPGDRSIETVVLTTLSRVWQEPVDELRDRPTLSAHDWDSLATLEVLAQLESELSISFDLRAFHQAHTIDDLIDLTAAGGGA